MSETTPPLPGSTPTPQTTIAPPGASAPNAPRPEPVTVGGYPIGFYRLVAAFPTEEDRLQVLLALGRTIDIYKAQAEAAQAALDAVIRNR